MKNSKNQRRSIFQNQIVRIARIYITRPVCVDNLEWHGKLIKMQGEAIKNKNAS
jgi:hypothetical protein